MAYIRLTKTLAIIAVLVTIGITVLNTTTAAALSGAQQGAISQNCSTIKQSLEQLQHSDSRTRTYLGATYETLANKFIVPLNIRLVKNNLPTFPDIQASFTSEQAKFKDAYTEYMKSLGELIATDCKNDPDGFYSKLGTTRKKREILQKTTKSLANLTDQQYNATAQLLETLK